MTSIIPSLRHIRSVRVETTSVRVMVVGFRILFLCQPSLDRPSSQADSLGDLLDVHPLLVQCQRLLIAIIPFSLMSRVRLSIKRYEGQQGLLWHFGFCSFFRLQAFSQLCTTMHQRFFYRFCQVFHEMKTICGLNGLWGSKTRCGGIIPSAITAHH